MKPPILPPSQPAPAPIAVDRVRLIRRSTRCFVFGAFGAVPFFGLGLAYVAFRLQRQLARETGDKIAIRLLFLISALGLELMIMFLRLDLEFLAAMSALLCLCAPLFLVHRQYRLTDPPEWNPARHLVYWGIALAFAGVVLSCIGAVVVCDLLVQE